MTVSIERGSAGRVEQSQLIPMNNRMAELMRNYPFNPDRYIANSPEAQVVLDARRAAMAGEAVLVGPISAAKLGASLDAQRHAHQPGGTGNGKA